MPGTRPGMTKSLIAAWIAKAASSAWQAGLEPLQAGCWRRARWGAMSTASSEQRIAKLTAKYSSYSLLTIRHSPISSR